MHAGSPTGSPLCFRLCLRGSFASIPPPMKIERVIEIGVPPEAVWPHIADVERWREWTPSITSIEPLDPGGLAVGVRFRVLQPKFPPVVWRVSSVVPGRSFEWVARSPGMTSTGRHVVEPRPGGGSVVTLAVIQEGFLAAVVGRMLAPLSRSYVEMEAEGLKRRSEKG